MNNIVSEDEKYESAKNLLTKLIDGSISLNEENVWCLDYYLGFNYIEIIKHNFDNIGVIKNLELCRVFSDNLSFVNLLREKKYVIDKDSPIIIKSCGTYVIEQYNNGVIDNSIIYECFPFFKLFFQEIMLKVYFEKGFYDLSMFKKIKCVNGEVSFFPFINCNIIKYDSKSVIKGDSLISIYWLCTFLITNNKLDMIDAIHFTGNIPYGQNTINALFKIVNENNIEFIADGGFSICSNYDNCIEFMSLCNYGRVELAPFDLDIFKKLLAHTEECMNNDNNFHVTLDVPIDWFMKNEEYFLKLETIVPIYFYSTINFRFNDKEKNNSANNDDVVFFGSQTVSRKVSTISLDGVDGVKAFNKFLDDMVSDIKNSDLSTIEKIAAVYKIVKSFNYRYYLNSMNVFDKFAPSESRNKYLILLNDYIVCRGYDNIFVDLLKRVNIEACLWTLDCKNVKDGGQHSRVFVNIEDNTYNANGYYMFDVTWDSNADSKWINTKEENFNSDIMSDNYRYFCMSVRQAHDYDELSSDYYYFGNDPDCLNDKCFRYPEEYINSLNDLGDIIDIIKYLDHKLFELVNKVDSIEEKKKLIIDQFKQKTKHDIETDSLNQAIENANNFFIDSGRMPTDRIKRGR